MVQYRYLGYGVTNEDGIAKLDHDAQGNQLSHSYTGTGAGKVDIVASLDDEIDDSSLVSETYELYDTLFYDGGVTGNSNLSQWIYPSSISASVGSDGTTITSSSSSTQYFTANTGSTGDSNDFYAPFCFEFDIVSTNGDVGLIVWASGQNANKSFASFNLTSNNHIRIEVHETQVRYFCDGVELTPLSITTTLPLRLGFTLYNSSSVIKFKNVKIYPI